MIQLLCCLSVVNQALLYSQVKRIYANKPTNK